MSKVITFSRHFQKSHPKAGEPTWFVEKIWKSIWDAEKSSHNPFDGYFQYYDEAFPLMGNEAENIHSHLPKHHTIRGGNRFKVGDMFSPRVWSGKPYASKQIIIAPDIEVKKTWHFECDANGVISVGGFYIDENIYKILAINDGLSLDDFNEWIVMPCFRKGKPFVGQIICWSDHVCY